ncbi:MAG TPA: pilus assembly protein CpaE [Nocardioides sp.]|nr:pilus assembly protein CpaE [Nocardioides sp.]HET9840622.1 pilus assembly protein CpaE [Nocardioides sp.]
MISRQLATALRDAGLAWTPTKGDWFVIPDRGLDQLEFVVSDMVVETRRMAFDRQLLAFNGTTEWAMDTLAASEALWLPREDQLREVLGEAFMGLEHIPGETPGYAVTMLLGDTERRYVDVDVEAAYARAALALLAQLTG